ncbi:MAG: amidohydrolase family protein [Chloroflexi bacterium]|nr:amidohydrolase family protein [Chloroflexota bacterium]
MSPRTAADLVLLNGNIHTMDAARPRARAVAIGGGHILGVGSNDDVQGWINGAAVMRDLGGQTLLPGFYDSHNHMLMTGLDLMAVDLSRAKSIADVLQAIEQRAAATPPGQWLVSSARWHESQLAEQRFPGRDELDRVAAAHPVLLQRGGHNVVANSFALERAGIESGVANPPGGTFVRDANGALTGHAIGAAAQELRARMPTPSEALLQEALRKIERAYNAAGITSVIDPGLNVAQINAYRSRQQPMVRASLMWRLQPGFSDPELQAALGQLHSGAMARDLDHPWARVLAIKLGVDGGVEPATTANHLLSRTIPIARAASRLPLRRIWRRSVPRQLAWAGRLAPIASATRRSTQPLPPSRVQTRLHRSAASAGP